MALVKKSKITSDAVKAPERAVQSAAAAVKPAPRRAVTGGPDKQTLYARVAAATEELAAGLTQASAATRELGQSMEQIAAGAEEAAGASQEQSAAMKRIVANLNTARAEADNAGRRSDAVAGTLAEASVQITASVQAIQRNAERQVTSVGLMTELQARARDIGEITQAVSRISDQTNLLALNAAIEAARAGDHGRGFAVVADEVRALAEVSDRNARDVQELASSIEKDVQAVTQALQSASELAARESASAVSVAQSLRARREEMTAIAAGNREAALAAMEAERAAVEAERGAEQVASAAEEQSAGSEEARTAVQQQAKSLDQAQAAAQALAALAEDLRAGKGRAGASAQIGTSAEELSATVQELSSSATQVMAAVEEINRACQLQASATQQTSAALAQIEKSARLTEQKGKSADENIRGIEAGLASGRSAVESLVSGVADGLKDTRESLATVNRLGVVARNIEKIVDAIALVVVQTGMLAVSGSVEAARAGDTGRGFAIVSNDIRTLAREASANVERARDSVRGILDQITALRAELDQVIASSTIEVQNNESTTALLEKMGGEIAEMAKASQVLVEGAAVILASAGEVTKGARQVAAAAEEASAASRQAATAATEQSRGAEDLAAAVEEIASLADELKSHDD